MRLLTVSLALLGCALLILPACDQPGDGTDFFGKLPVSDGPGPDLLLIAGSTPPPNAGIGRSDANVSMLQFDVTAGSTEDVVIDSITFHGAGTGDDAADITSCNLFRDLDGNGLFSPGVDSLAAFGFSYVGDDGTLTAPMNYTLSASATETFILLYSFSGTADTDETFTVTLSGPADVQAHGALSALAAVVTCPSISGCTVTIDSRGSVTVAVGAQIPTGGVIDPGTTTDLVVHQVSLTTDVVEDVEISQIVFHAAGTLDDTTHLSSVMLALDTNDSGAYEAGTDTVLDTAPYAADDGAVTFTFSGTPRTLTADTTETWILVYNFSSPVPGSTFSASLTAPADIGATGVTSGLSLTAQGTFPVAGPTFQIHFGSLAVIQGAAHPAAASVTPAATTAVSQIELTAGTVEDVQVTAITFHAAGTGDDSVDLSTVSLYIDNGTTAGVLDASDTLISAGNYSSNDGTASFTGLTQTVTAGTSQDWLLACTFTGGNTGDTYRSDVTPTADISADGVLSGVPATITGALIQGNDFTVQYGTLALAVGGQNPTGSSVTPPVSNVAVLQFTLTAGPAEGVTVASVTLHASGTGDDVNDLTSANLYLDNGTVKGAYDSGDTLLASGVYAADNGSCTYSVNRTLSASGSEDWLSVYTFSGGTTGATFAADITPGTDVSASGAHSSQTVTATGSQIQGNTFTIGGITSTWRAVTTSGTTPSGRWGHSAVYDSSNNRIIYFGGSTSSTIGSGLLAGINYLSTGTVGSEAWSITPTTPGPSARMWHTAVMDNTNGYMYIYGGLDSSLKSLPSNGGDVWRYNGSGTWTKFTASTGSAFGKPRCMHSAVWDATNSRMIVFAGMDYLSGTPHYHNDAYQATFNSTTSQVTWSSFSFTTTSPALHGCAPGWDSTSTTHRMVFHGGYNGTTYYSSTYSFVPSTSPTLGTITTSSDPSARYRSIFCTDASNGLYIFGGDTGSACLQDTYFFNFSTNTWATVSGGTNIPGVRCSGAGAWDSGNSRFILFGGYDVYGTASTPLQDLHELK